MIFCIPVTKIEWLWQLEYIGNIVRGSVTAIDAARLWWNISKQE